MSKEHINGIRESFMSFAAAQVIVWTPPIQLQAQRAERIHNGINGREADELLHAQWQQQWDEDEKGSSYRASSHGSGGVQWFRISTQRKYCQDTVPSDSTCTGCQGGMTSGCRVVWWTRRAPPAERESNWTPHNLFSFLTGIRNSYFSRKRIFKTSWFLIHELTMNRGRIYGRELLISFSNLAVKAVRKYPFLNIKQRIFPNYRVIPPTFFFKNIQNKSINQSLFSENQKTKK